MSWIKCSERFPELRHSSEGAGLTSGRRWSDPVIAAQLRADGKLECWGFLTCAMKDEDDWGRASSGVHFWGDMDDNDICCIDGDADCVTHWMPIPEVDGRVRS